MKIVYKDALYEANRKIPTEDQLLQKYKGKDEYFFSYRSMNKVGINPNSRWNTPNGIYTYSFTDTINTGIPYKGESTEGYIYVIKIKDNIKGLDSENYGIDEFNIDLNVLKNKYPDVESYVSKITEANYFKKLWQILYQLKTSSNNWSNLILGLGYMYVRDRCTGTIHKNEPCQTLFISPKAYDIVGYGTFGEFTEKIHKFNDVTIKHNVKHFGTDKVNAVANYLIKTYKKTDKFYSEILYHANSSFCEQVLNKIISKLSKEDVRFILSDWRIYSNMSFSHKYIQKIINDHPYSVNKYTILKILKLIPEEISYDLINKNSDIISEVTKNNILWISDVPYANRFKILSEFKDSFNEGISKTGSIQTFISTLRPLTKSKSLLLFEMFKPAFLELTKKGYYEWLGDLFYIDDSKETMADIITDEFNEQFKENYKEGDTEFLRYFHDNETLKNKVIASLE